MRPRRPTETRGIGITLCLVFACFISHAQSGPRRTLSSASSIVPGQRVGALRLGDSRATAQELFPAKENVDQEWADSQPDCGTVVNWVDIEDKGNVFLHLRNGAVFQIDSATPRFKTEDGITSGATPEQVREHYKGLRAFNLSNGTSEAEGERPLVYWVDETKGIAFGFSFYRRNKSWYLYHIVVFRPGTEICPEPATLSSSDKRELPPYSLNPDAPETNDRK